jgi:hypothetical protein
MASINNYAKVAAGEIIESNPEAMRMTRDFLAMRREGRQNFIASVLSGGKIGGFGRVTEANMAGPDMSRLSDLEKRKDAMLKDAQKARMDAIKALAEGDDGVRSLAEELIKLSWIGRGVSLRTCRRRRILAAACLLQPTSS